MPEYSARETYVHDLPSTTWVWKKCILRGTPRPLKGKRERSELRRPLSSRVPTKPLSIEVRYRGGPEGDFTVTSRGRSWRFPGHYQMIDVIQFINGA
jgi:hypothetical protein